MLDRLDEVPAGPVWVHCAGGYRAGVVAALLQARGHDVVAVDDEFDRALAGLAVPPRDERLQGLRVTAPHHRRRPSLGERVGDPAARCSTSAPRRSSRPCTSRARSTCRWTCSREHRDELRRDLRQDVVLVCRSGQRAGRAEQALPGRACPACTCWPTVSTAGSGRRGGQPRPPAGTSSVRCGWSRARWCCSACSPASGARAQWFSAALGAGLVVAALTGTCAMGMALARMPWNRRGAGNPTSPIEELVARG